MFYKCHVCEYACEGLSQAFSLSTHLSGFICYFSNLFVFICQWIEMMKYNKYDLV